MAILTGTLEEDEIGGTLQSDLILALSGNDTVVGSGGADSIDGGTGNDTLYAGALSNIDDGATDAVNGGAGNDIVYGTAGDMLNGGTGRDTVHLNLASAEEGVTADFRTMTLGVDIGLGELVQLDLPLLTGTLGGFEVVASVKGSAFADEFVIANVGRAGANVDAGGGDDSIKTSGGNDVLDGGSGADRLNAGGGRDNVDGGNGDDTLMGAAGMDVLTGGVGADRFIFDADDSGATRNRADRVTDFSQNQGDRIVLSNLDAIVSTEEVDGFTFIGDGRFSGAAGELRFSQIDGNTFIAGDTNGDRVSDFVIQLDGLVDLTAADFRI
jgi:Ca2+-binding RTX toxin-like protein